MTTLQPIDLARMLIWPVALLVPAIVFRQPLSRLMVTITQLRFRDLEIDFGRELERLQAMLPPEAVGDGGMVPENIQALEGSAADLATQAASAQPLAGVLLAWTALETRIKKRGEAGHSADLPPDLEAVIQGLSELCRAAAGGKIKGGRLSADQALAYIRLAHLAAAQLDSMS